jgi:hypothetical protein
MSNKFIKQSAILAGILLIASYGSAADRLEPGLVGEYYQMDAGLEDFPTIPASREPTLRRVDRDINFASTTDAWPGTKFVDNFYVRWTGVLKVPKDGHYKFYLDSDDGSRLFIDGKQVVDNGGTHAMAEVSGETELKAGEHEIKAEFFEAEVDAGCILSWEAPDGDKQVLPAAVLFHKGTGGPATAEHASVEPGLQAEYYNTEEGSEDFPTFPASKKPDLKRIDKNINFASTQDEWPGTHFKDFFYIKWTGNIKIPSEGVYTFFLESDDGSRMFIDGKQIIDNGGAHAMEEVSGTLKLTAGNHALKVEYFEKDIDAGCIMRWKSDSIDKQVVPGSVLFH